MIPKRDGGDELYPSPDPIDGPTWNPIDGPTWISRKDDCDGEGWKRGYEDSLHDTVGPGDHADILNEICEDAEQDLGNTFRTLALKMMWDILMHAMAPSRITKKEIINQILEAGYNDVVKQYSDAGINGLDEALGSTLKVAMKNASEDFGRLFYTPVLCEKFLEKTREALSRGLKE